MYHFNRDNGKWALLQRKTIIHNKWLSVYENDYSLPNGSRIDGFYVVEEGDGVVTVPITRDNQVLLVRQYRPTVDEFTYDFPAGFVEPNDTSLIDRAKLELVQETGYTASTWYSTGSFAPAPHRLKKVIHCFLALDLTKVSEQKLDDTEFIEYQYRSVPELIEMIEKNEFRCGTCISSFFKAILFDRNLLAF